MFFYYLYKNKIAKRILLFSIIPFFILWISSLLRTDKNTFDSFPVITEFLIFIVALIFYFYEKMRIVTIYPLYQSISFWLCVGLFIYFTGNFFYLLFTSTSKDPSFIKQMKEVYSIVNIVKDLILGLAWFAYEQKEKIEDELSLPKDLHLDDDLSFTLPPNL